MKKTVLTFLITLSLFALAMTATVFAYFSLSSDGFFGVKIELLFDKLDASYSGQIDGVNFNANATWGTQANPYVISDVNHLMNLSSLQNRRYFENADGSPSVPYFLVSTDRGLPVLIDGNGATIESIGAHDSPFIGTISGIIGDTLYKADGTSTKLGALAASTSCIYNFNVIGNGGEPDVGLFGTVSYSGTEAADGESFTGQASKISNLLLTDLTVKASHKISALEQWWTNFFDGLAHKFTFTEDPKSSTQTAPHETNHIGIFCGHAEYAMFENISIYYTAASDGKGAARSAIDISAADGNSNYYSSTGIVGLMYNLNPTKDANGNIVAGSGTSVGDLGHVSGGGGGIGSGVHTGYFFADEMFNKYVAAGNTSQTLKDAAADGVNLSNATSMPVSNNGTKDMYYFRDTNKVFTFALSDKADEDAVEKIWTGAVDTIKLSSSKDKFSAGEDYGKSYNLELTKFTDTDTFSLSSIADLRTGNDYLLGTASGEQINVINATGVGGENHVLDASSAEYDNNGNFVSAKVFDGLESESIVYKYSLKKTANNRFQTNITTTAKYLGVSSEGQNNMGLYSGNTETDNSTVAIIGTYKSQPVYDYNWKFQQASAFALTVNDVTTNPFVSDTDKYIISISTSYRSSALLGFSSTSVTLYLTYDDHGKFSLTDDSSAAKPFYLFSASRIVGDASVSGWSDKNPDVIKDADKHVLYAKNEYRHGAAPADGAAENILYTTSSVNDGYYGYGSAICYSKLNYELRTAKSLNWAANPLSSNASEENMITGAADMISMKEAIGEASISQRTGLFGQKFTSTSGIVKAPIGTNGTEYYLPSGSIGFEINKVDANGYAHINVIAVVTPGIAYKNSSIGIWTGYFKDQSGWLEQGTSKFDASNPQYAFPLPTSTMLGDEATKTEFFYNVSYAATEEETPRDYWARFHTESILVAHTFDIPAKVGDIFLLAATSGPLRLAYFSVSGVAGGGGIGSEGSELGTIDFVYEYNGKIVTVDTYNEGGTDYSYFRYSYVYMYTDLTKDDGTFVTDLDSMTLSVYRALTDAGPPGMTVAGTGDAVNVKIIRADKYFSDNVTYTVDGADKNENVVTN